MHNTSIIAGCERLASLERHRFRLLHMRVLWITPFKAAFDVYSRISQLHHEYIREGASRRRVTRVHTDAALCGWRAGQKTRGAVAARASLLSKSMVAMTGIARLLALAQTT